MVVFHSCGSLLVVEQWLCVVLSLLLGDGTVYLSVKVSVYRARIYRGALWILGEYCSTKEDIQSVMTEVRRSLGEVRF